MTRDCWKDFAASGRVSDYLRYREKENPVHRQDGVLSASAGGVEHGTEDRPDRHDIIRSACR